MSRYIDADALLDIFKTLKWDASCSIVEDMPTADVVPSKYGCGNAPYCSWVFEVDEDE